MLDFCNELWYNFFTTFDYSAELKYSIKQTNMLAIKFFVYDVVKNTPDFYKGNIYYGIINNKRLNECGGDL